MSFEVLYRRWRPQTLGEVVGQEMVTTTLRNAVRSNRVGHAYLFCGPRGTGKTSTGRILAKAVNCQNPLDGEPCNACEACVSISEGRCLDVIEIDAASNRGVEDIRLLRERVNYAAGTVQRKVYIVDEVHMLTDYASNALLKTLEEPPPHVVFILATTEFHRVLATIISRCQCFHFRRLAPTAIAAKLRLVGGREGIEAEDESFAAIAQAAGGSLRDAENLLQQLVASHGRRLTAEEVREVLGIADESYISALIHTLFSGDLAGGLRVLHGASDAGVDMRHFGGQLILTLRDMLLVKSGCEDIVEGGADRVDALRQVVKDTSFGDIVRAIQRFSENTARSASQPLLTLELALVDSVVRPLEPSSEQKSVDSGATMQESVSRSAKPVSTESPSGRLRKVTRVVSETDKERATNESPSITEVPDSQLSDNEREESVQMGEPEPRDAEVRPAAEEQTTQSQELELEGSDDLRRVRASWKEYVDSLRGLGSTGNLDAFLRSACEPISLENDVLVLRFSHEFHKSKVEDPKYRHVVEERLHQFYGCPYQVKCVLEAQSGSRPASSPSRIPEESLVDAALRMGARPRRQK